MGIHHAIIYPEIESSAQMPLFRTVMKFNAHAMLKNNEPGRRCPLPQPILTKAWSSSVILLGS
jgi:hypothetical protein